MSVSQEAFSGLASLVDAMKVELGALVNQSDNAPWKAQVEAMLIEHDSKADQALAGLRQLHVEANTEVDGLKKRLKEAEEKGSWEGKTKSD